MHTLLRSMRTLHRSDVLLWKPPSQRYAPREPRRHMPIIADLRFVLAIDGVPAAVLRSGELIGEWLALLRELRGVDTQTRATLQHVSHEHDEWVGAFNFFIGIQSLFSMLVRPLAADPDAAAAPHAPAGVEPGGAVEHVCGAGAGDVRSRLPQLQPFDESRGWGPTGQSWAGSSGGGGGGGGGRVPLPERRGLVQQAVEALLARDGEPARPPLVCQHPSGSSVLVGVSAAAEKLCFHLPLERFVASVVHRLAATAGGDRALRVLLRGLADETAAWPCPNRYGSLSPGDVRLWEAAAAACSAAGGRVWGSVRQVDGVYQRTVCGAEALLDAPLQLTAAAAAVEANLWVRNGSALRQQLQSYASLSPPLCRLMADLDHGAIQAALAVLPAEVAFPAIFSAFGHLPLLQELIAAGTVEGDDGHGAGGGRRTAGEAARAAAVLLSRNLGAPDPPARRVAPAAGAELLGGAAAAGGAVHDPPFAPVGSAASWGADARQRGRMLCGALRLVLQLISHPPMPPGAEREADAMRTQLAHLLLLRPRQHSELASSLRSFDDESPPPQAVQAAIDAVAVRQPATLRDAADAYALRPGLERYYSPVYPHLSTEDHQQALQRLAALAQAAARREAAHVQAPPPAPPLAPCHPCFRPLRLLAAWPPLLRLVRALALHALRQCGGAAPAEAPADGEADVCDVLEQGVQLVALSLLAFEQEGAAADACGEAEREVARASDRFFAALCWSPSASVGAGGWATQLAAEDAEQHTSLLWALAELSHRVDGKLAGADGLRGHAATGGGTYGGAGGGAVRLSLLGLRDLRWILHAARRDAMCAELLDTVESRHAERTAAVDVGEGAGEGAGDAATEAQREGLLRQRRRAQAKQRAMADMARQRAAFEATLAAGDGSTGGTEPAALARTEGLSLDAATTPPSAGGVSAPSTPQSAATAAATDRPACILCHGTDDAGTNDMVGLALTLPSMVRHAGCASDGAPRPELGDPDWDQAEDWALLGCGHTMHLACWVECWRRLLAAGPDYRGSEPQLLCPLCRALSNVVVPLKPVTPAALAAAARTTADTHATLADGEVAGSVPGGPIGLALRWLRAGLPRALDRLASAEMPSVGGGARHAALDGVTPAEAAAMLESLQRLNAPGEPHGQPLPSTLLPFLVRAWRAVAFAASTAAVAAELEAPDAAPAASAAPLHRELQPLRGLQLRPVLLQYALAREYRLFPAVDVPPGPKWHMLAEEGVQLVRSLLSGGPLPAATAEMLGARTGADGRRCCACHERLATHRARLCGHTLTCFQCASSLGSSTCPACGVLCTAERMYGPCSSLLWCDLNELLVLIVSILPPPTPTDAAAIAQLLGIAAAGQALLVACGAEAQGQGRPTGAAEPSASAPLAEAAEAMRARLAAAAGVRVSSDAPRGANLAVAVEGSVGRYNRYARAVLASLWPAPPDDQLEWQLASAGEVLSSLEALEAILSWVKSAADTAAGEAGAVEMKDDVSPSSQPQDDVPPPPQPQEDVPPSPQPELELTRDLSDLEPMEADVGSHRSEAWPRSLVQVAPRPAPSLDSLPQPYLYRMPKDFNTLAAMLHGKPCVHCHKPPAETALCLVCGAILCAGFMCQKNLATPSLFVDDRAFMLHARTCGAGCGIFYMVHEVRPGGVA